MRRRGLIPSARTLSIEIRDAPPEIAQYLKLPAGESVYQLRRLRFVSNEPVAVVTSYLSRRVFAGLEHIDLENQSLYEIFEQAFNRKLGWAEEIIGAVVATGEDATVLETVPGSALLMVKETAYDIHRVPIEYSVSLLRGDRYTASVLSVRKN